MYKRRYYELRQPPYEDVCKRYGKPRPRQKDLQAIARSLDCRFIKEDFASLRKGGAFTEHMAISFEVYLGLPEHSTTEIKLTDRIPYYLSNEPTFLDRGLEYMLDYLTHNFRLHENAWLQDESSVVKFADEIDIAFGFMLEEATDPTSKNLDNPEYLRQLGHDNHPCPGTEYHELLNRWRERNPNTTLKAYTSKNWGGEVVLLPLTDDAYEEIRAGRKGIVDIQACDILRKSTNFFVEAFFPRPFIDEPVEVKNRANFSCLLAQFSMSVPTRKGGNIRCLSFSAAKATTKYLTDCGYTYVEGTNLRHSEFPLMEFVPSKAIKPVIAAALTATRVFLNRPRTTPVNGD